MKWIAAAILVGALIVAGTLIAIRPAGPEVFETERAVEALEHAEAGWYCEVGDAHGGYELLPAWLLEVLAKEESDFGEPLNAHAGPDFRCTRERG